jgi:hypothetical protein
MLENKQWLPALALTQAGASLTLDEQTTLNSFVGMVDLLKAPHHHE